MIFQHTYQQVLDGSKTQTRRRAGAKQRYYVDKTYAVQPGRGKASVGRIRITEIREIDRAGNISESDARAEGYESSDAFRAMWEKMYGHTALDEPCIALTFTRIDGDAA